MPILTDEEVQEVIDRCRKVHYHPFTLELAADLQHARLQVIHLQRLLRFINSTVLTIECDPSEIEHQIREHRDTLPIITRGLAQSVQSIADVCQEEIWTELEEAEKKNNMKAGELSEPGLQTITEKEKL